MSRRQKYPRISFEPRDVRHRWEAYPAVEQGPAHLPARSFPAHSPARSFPAHSPARSFRHPPYLRGRDIGVWYANNKLEDYEAAEEQQALTDVIVPDTHIKAIHNLVKGQVPLKKVQQSPNYAELPDSDFKEEFLELINTSMQDKLQQNFIGALEKNDALDNELFDSFMKNGTNPRFLEMQSVRKRLPTYYEREEIVTAINNNRIVIISGGTGCGKSTQIPQYILDHYILNKKGTLCKIICSQPRRISAISLAQRIAAERNEDGPGTSVGYHIRLEHQLPRSCASITFCTTGIILKKMESNVGFKGITHLILDEIHERDMMSDFILAIIKQIIHKTNVKVVIMSATMNAEKFAEYFNVNTVINIPGFTYDVKEFYLEDALLRTGYHFPTPRMNYRQIQSQKQFETTIFPYANSLRQQSHYPGFVIEQLVKQASEECTIELAIDLIDNIVHTESDPGAILVFLTGLGDINKMNDLMQSSGRFPLNRFLIIPLHSKMATVHQQNVFFTPPQGIRKIILSTNIAETSVTIEDVVYVIDCGKVKISDYNSTVSEDTLQSQWVSKANADQRRGRAGRLRPGICYHLFSKFRNNLLEPFPKPELLRSRLDSVILNIKLLQLGKAEEFLATCLDSPEIENIKTSVSFLQRLGAIDDNEILTPLGFHLGKLPVAPQIAKMMLLGAIFSCTDPILDVAIALDYRDPFIIPLFQEADARSRKKQLTDGHKSDHLLLHLVMNHFVHINNQHQFCWKYYICNRTVNQLIKMKRQFLDLLYESKFLDPAQCLLGGANVNSKNFHLVKSIICGCLYPNVIIGKSPTATHKRYTKLFTPDKKKVEFHPKSTLSSQDYYESPFFVFYKKIRSSSDFLHDASMAYPIQFLLFADKLKVEYDKEKPILVINENLKFGTNIESLLIIMELRDRLNKFLLLKASEPAMVNWFEENDVIVLKAINILLTMNTITRLS